MDRGMHSPNPPFYGVGDIRGSRVLQERPGAGGVREGTCSLKVFKKKIMTKYIYIYIYALLRFRNYSTMQVATECSVDIVNRSDIREKR